MLTFLWVSFFTGTAQNGGDSGFLSQVIINIKEQDNIPENFVIPKTKVEHLKFNKSDNGGASSPQEMILCVMKIPLRQGDFETLTGNICC